MEDDQEPWYYDIATRGWGLYKGLENSDSDKLWKNPGGQIINQWADYHYWHEEHQEWYVSPAPHNFTQTSSDPYNPPE